MLLYGREWTRREIEAYVGKIENIAGVQKYGYSEGPESGVDMIQVRTASGLTYNVNASHALDISSTEFRGVPISWQAIIGEVHPAYFESTGLGFLRSAAGGLLMTCGLSQVGSPTEDDNEKLGLHGRVHHTPARQVVAEGNWINDEYELRIRGIIEESRIMGEHLRLIREIKSRVGENKIIINDIVENTGFHTVPHMILYHFNFGFPLMMDGSEITIPSNKIVARDKGISVESYDRWLAPEVGFEEQVYYHSDFKITSTDLEKKKMTNVLIKNPHFPVMHQQDRHSLISVRLSWNVDALPNLVQWKMPGAGTYVLGLEPSNCFVEGRAAERAKGTLVNLAPGEKKNYFLELEISAGNMGD